MQATLFTGVIRKRIINEVRQRIRALGLEAIFESKRRCIKKNGASILLNNMNHLVADYTVLQLSDLLTQAGGQLFQTNFLIKIVALIRGGSLTVINLQLADVKPLSNRPRRHTATGRGHPKSNATCRQSATGGNGYAGKRTRHCTATCRRHPSGCASCR